MPPSIKTRASIDDLYREKGKAELIGGRIIRFMASGLRPSRIALRIFLKLNEYADAAGRGEAYADGLGFAIPELASGRETFEPDAPYYVGPFPTDEMRFIEGPPIFAVEVRSEYDQGPSAKRLDYFEAGTLAVWDVDAVAGLIHLYRPDDPGRPVKFARGEVAHTEPAVPGWRFGVDDVFGPIAEA